MASRQKREIIYLNPVFKQMIWGGDRLRRDWNYDIPGDNTGECWAVSAHPNGDCTVKEGTYKGKTLSSLWTDAPELFGNMECDRFPLLVKIIDAKDDLSIQVHPNDEYAGKNENGSLGKTECWYILDAADGAELVVGHNAKDRDELAAMIEGGRWDELIRTIPVKKGDFIQIDPGTVHSIKGGIQLLETQQNSDITYRIYDYGRLSDGKLRELHIDKGMDVITVPAKPLDKSVVRAHEIEEKAGAVKLLEECGYYKVWRVDVDGLVRVSQEYPFMIMSVVDGNGFIDGQPIKKGDHFILPCGYGNVDLQGKMRLIASCP